MSYVLSERRYSFSKSRNFTDACMYGAQTCLTSSPPPIIQKSVNFRSFVELYLRSLNPLSPKSDQRQISPSNIPLYKTEWS